MTKVYIASPFFNEKEVSYVEQVEKILESKGLNIFSPMRNQMDTDYGMQEGSREWSICTFMNDVKYLKWCDIVVGIYHGNYSDSGTAWELGYAYAMDKPVVLIQVGGDSNLMVHEGSHVSLTIDELKDYDFSLMQSNFYTGKMF